MQVWVRAAVLPLAFLMIGCGENSSGGAGQAALEPWVGKSLAAVAVQTLDGEAQPLNDPLLLNGKPVVINVWATWCTPCLKEMPTLDALGKQGKYTVIAIATDKDTQTVKDFLKKQDWGSGMTVLFDRLGAVTRKDMGVAAVPATYVTDPSLTVKLVAAGERDWASPAMQAKMGSALMMR